MPAFFQSAWLIEAKWGPSEEFEKGNAWWANEMDMRAIETAVSYRNKGVIASILHKNPNLGVDSGHGTVFGTEAVQFLEGLEPDQVEEELEFNEDPNAEMEPQNTPCAVDTQLPADGLGYILKSGTSRTRQYGTRSTIAGLQNLAAT